MSLNFPDSPVNGQIYTFNNRSWQWNAAGQVWTVVGTPVSVTGHTGATGAGCELAGQKVWPGDGKLQPDLQRY